MAPLHQKSLDFQTLSFYNALDDKNKFSYFHTVFTICEYTVEKDERTL